MVRFSLGIVVCVWILMTCAHAWPEPEKPRQEPVKEAVKEDILADQNFRDGLTLSLLEQMLDDPCAYRIVLAERRLHRIMHKVDMKGTIQFGFTNEDHMQRVKRAFEALEKWELKMIPLQNKQDREIQTK